MGHMLTFAEGALACCGAKLFVGDFGDMESILALRRRGLADNLDSTILLPLQI